MNNKPTLEYLLHQHAAEPTSPDLANRILRAARQTSPQPLSLWQLLSWLFPQPSLLIPLLLIIGIYIGLSAPLTLNETSQNDVTLELFDLDTEELL